jgi:Adenylate and Guanylate cyclase catalytic domain
MGINLFVKDQVYENVYLVFVDASGHSNVVRRNPRDVSAQAFDLLYERIAGRLQRVVTKNRCEIAVVWSWLGDGGMIAIHDKSEKNSLLTTFDFVTEVLKLDLPNLKSEFANDNINGELHIRIAVHKGTIKYTDDGQQGFIHSSDINWGAHLEKATPKDSISISKEIFDILPSDKKKDFVSVGKFEEREAYVFTPNADESLVTLNWRASQGFSEMELVQCYLERISQKDKAELIDTAKDTVIDFGTTLNTCSNYLFSTERPVPYRDAVCRLLERGGKFVCYMLSPDSPGSRQLVELRKEDTDEKLRNAMTRFQQFKSINPTLTNQFKVFQFDNNPNFAAMIIDPESDDSVCLYSPYLSVISQEGTGRADMPHYLVSKKKHRMYKFVWDYVSSYINIAKEFL